jgi:hypothetical protein
LAGFVPVIDVFDEEFKDVDARHKAGHDDELGYSGRA